MSVLGLRRLNGVPMGILVTSGVAPSRVGNLTAGTASATTIAVTYTASNGTAPIRYTGWSSTHAANQWVQNSGGFSASGGTFVGLVASTVYDLRIVAANVVGTSSTDLTTGIATQSQMASSFTVGLSRSSGPAGAAVVLTVAPVGGSWPVNQTVVPSTTGLSGSFDNASLVGVGAAALTFTFRPVSGPGVSGTLSVSASGLSNGSGAQPYTIDAVATSTQANRFDMVLGASAVAAGSQVQVIVYPNAGFPAGNIVLSGTNGSFSPSATIVLTRNSTTPVTVNYTPTAPGEHVISATNSAGLYAPYPAPLTVFSSASGTSRSLAGALTRSDMVTYQRDAPSGNPSGFSLPWAKGWGEVWLNVSAISGSTAGLWVRLFDAMSAGASTSVGTGTALHASTVQVYGAVSGPGTVRLLLPAGPHIYYADVATDAAFTNPVRIAQRFRVGVVIGHFSRSQESGLSRAYAYTGNVPLPTSYSKTATWVGFDYRYADYDSGWFMHDGTTVDPYSYHYSESSSSGAQEIGRLLESQLGVCVGIAGCSATGGGLDSMVNHDGSFSGGFAGSVASAVGNKFRYLWMATGNWDGVDTNYPAETQSENRTRFTAGVDWVAKTFPACAVIGWVSSASGVFGSDGSRLLGYTRNQMILLNEIEPINPMVVSKECYSWNEYYTNHATMAARVQYVRAGFRLLMAAELAGFNGFQSANRGPRLGVTGSIRSGTRTISIPFSLAGGSALQAVGINFSNPSFTVGSASSTEVASLFAVYLPGGYQGNGKPIRIDTAVINGSAKTIDLALTGSSGVVFSDNTTGTMPSGFTVQFAADFAASNSSVPPGSNRAVMITDDRVDTANGIPHGWHMRPALDIAVSTV